MRYLFGWMAVASLMLAGCDTTTVQRPGDTGSGVTTDAEPDGVDALSDPVAEAPSEEMTEEEQQATEIAASGDAPAGDPPPAVDESAPSIDALATADPAAATAGEATATPVPVEDGKAALSAENTKIQFVGTHTGEKPDPRVGGFAQFSGEAVVDSDAKTLQSVTVDIDTTSLFTPFEKLTTHLQSVDFFDVNEHPTAKFESTKIEAEEGGMTVVTGNLTLHGETKEISFPATVQISDEGLTVHSEFGINRSDFGMDFGPDKVDDKVMMTVIVGQKTEVPTAE
jgi:polyisoprenoid-binding protein YceI